jgi:hypothetical protein
LVGVAGGSGFVRAAEARGEGDTPVKPCLTLLRDQKWKTPANIEYEYKGQDAVEEVKKAYAFCRAVLA